MPMTAKQETVIARSSSEQLTQLAKRPGGRRFQLQVAGDKKQQSIDLPVPAVQLLSKILGHMAEGEAVTVVPTSKMLSTHEAADMLNVSRPFLIKLLDKGTIPCQRVGTHRRVRMQDVLSYKLSMRQARIQAMDEMAELSQEIG